MGYVAFIIILCAMVVIHEFGHFIVAKLLGISVETFSVGFGPRLLGFRIGETDYRLSAIPLGGYVKFRGENLEMIQGKSEGSIDEFLAHPKWKRFLVAIAGPAFNIATALLIPMTAILIGFQDSTFLAQPVKVGLVRPGSAAEAAGLQRGDRILSYSDNQHPNWEDFLLDVRLRPNEEIPLKIDRGGQIVDSVVRVKAETFDKEQVGTIGIEPYQDHVRVDRVSNDSPAARAGLQAGDRIVAIEGEPVMSESQFRESLKSSNGQPITLKVDRSGQTVELKAAPFRDQESGDYRLGIILGRTSYVKTSSLAVAFRYAVDYNWRILRLTGVFLKQVFAGKRSARGAVAGPIGIAQATKEQYELGGWAATIELMGMLSLNLGVLNLLPIPVLDGGVIVLILIEALLGLVGITMSMNVRERIQQVGFVIVMLIMGFAIFNDVFKLGERWFSSPPAQQQTNK